ncbi:MAG: type IV secretion system protein [Thiobacillus sp.]
MALGDIALMLQPMIDAAVSKTAVFVPLGRTFLALAVVITVIFAVYEWWTGNSHGAIARVVHALLVLSIPLTLLLGDNYANTMNTVRNFFASELTQPLMSGTGSGSSAETLRDTINVLSASMFPEMQEAGAKTAGDGGDHGVVNAVKSAWANITSPIDALFRLNVTVRQMIYNLLLMIVAGFVSLALIFALYGPLFALQIGIIFGPLLIAWLPSPQFSHLAKSWFQFVLTQGFTLVIAVAIAVIGATAISAFAAQMHGLAAGGVDSSGFIEAMVVQAGGFIASLSVLIFVGLMLFKADNIASALIGGGHAGSSGIAAGLIARAAPKPAGGGLAKTGGVKP